MTQIVVAGNAHVRAGTLEQACRHMGVGWERTHASACRGTALPPDHLRYCMCVPALAYLRHLFGICGICVTAGARSPTATICGIPWHLCHLRFCMRVPAYAYLRQLLHLRHLRFSRRPDPEYVYPRHLFGICGICVSAGARRVV